MVFTNGVDEIGVANAQRFRMSLTGLLEDAGRAQTGSASIAVGISGARRNPAAAVAVDGRLRAFCEQERLTRIRGAHLHPTALPLDAMRVVLGLAGTEPEQVDVYVTAEDGVTVPAGLPHRRLDHHQGHAATAFLTSSFARAAVLVCDQHSNPEVSVWLGDGDNIVNQKWPWDTQAFASLFSQCSQEFGFPDGQDHQLEALARLDPGADAARMADLFRYANGTLRVDPEWRQKVDRWLRNGASGWPLEHGARVAASFQRALGDVLLELISDIRQRVGAPYLCLGGGLFYNTFFNTIIAESGHFEDVFVPPSPGNAGIAAGAALAASREQSSGDSRETVSAFLGPEYELEEIKRTLDNCKLSYECLSQSEVIARCARDLAEGRLVGWFQGPMEWGHRALGNRSILASPLSQYVLDNLNVFLKQRERYRAYGLSVCEHELDRYFRGPRRSAWMEYQYQVKDTEKFRHVLPVRASRLRVQTVDPRASLFSDLHNAFAAVSGTGVLVNTSFNGFSEPIVCSPRDAIRVFYGTGLDVLVLGRFVIRK